jgi:hypothetical protein
VRRIACECSLSAGVCRFFRGVAEHTGCVTTGSAVFNSLLPSRLPRWNSARQHGFISFKNDSVGAEMAARRGIGDSIPR